MTDREALRAQLIRHEGEVLHVYEDSLGYWTIGVGHLVDARRGGRISHEVAMLILDGDINECIADMAARFSWFKELDAIRQRALVDLRFNVGPQGLLGFRLFLAAMERGDYDAAARELVDSKWYGQVGQRAKTLEHMVRTGTEADGPRAA